MKSQMTAQDVKDLRRMQETSKRRKLLDGDWEGMLQQHGLEQLGKLRAKLVGKWDTSSNLYQNITDQISVRFDGTTTVTHATPTDQDTMRRLLVDWYPVAQLHERYVWGLLCNLVYVEWDTEQTKPFFLLATPDCVTMTASRHNPTRPAVIRWYRERETPGGKSAKYWDVWDISDPSAPSFRVLDDRDRDVTAAIAPDQVEWRGEGYPYRDAGGVPVLPFAVYYGRPPANGLWPKASFRGEIVFGTLQAALLWTATVHGILRASWDQRYLINGKVTGGAKQVIKDHHVQTVTPDPTSVVQIEGNGEGAPSAGAWGASLDIEATEGVVRRYESRLHVYFGLSPADTVIESLNPASGASITVRERGKRALQAKSTPAYQRGDAQLYRVVSAVARYAGVTVAESGYTTEYAGVALTAEERVTTNAYCAAERDRGVMSRTGHYMELHPGVDQKGAEQALTQQDMEAELAALKASSGQTRTQDSALNGAQVDSALAIVQEVVAGRLTTDMASNMLQAFFNLTQGEASNILAGADTLTPTTPEGTPDPA